MDKHTYIQYCLNILAFDNIKSQLSIAERSYLHKQWTFALDQKDNLMHPISKPTHRISKLGNLIRNAKWQRPELRYNQDRVLEVLDEATGLYEKFNPSEYE